MASPSRDANGRSIVQFIAADEKRRSIRLGKVTKRIAETFRIRVQSLVTANRAGHAIDDETSRWLTGLDNRMIDKLAAVGLVPRRESEASALGSFLKEYVSKRIDVKPATKEVWSQVTRNLREFFGEQRDLKTITEGDAEDFKLYLIGEGLASTTVAKRLQFARQFFRSAVKRKLIPSNPFAEVGAKATIKADRERFITREETDRLLATCPNIDWRVIVGLSRYGGLRCPSEVLTLEWADIDWENGRFLAHSPKTEHHPGKATRKIPLFPELRAILDEAFEMAADGAVYVVGNDAYRLAANTPGGWRNCNLRTQFGRIIKRAGLEPWPRLFHALRASRETELAREYPIHVVTFWLGNTPRIAMKHYLMATEEDFSKAMGRMVEKAVQNQVQFSDNSGAKSGAATCRDDSQDLALNDISRCETTAYASACEFLPMPAKYISGEDRIRTCGPVSRSSV